MSTIDRRAEFDTFFHAATGVAPFPWQLALFDEFLQGRFRETCDIPTGLGKTSVMAIWLLALAHHARAGTVAGFPRRLVYVVNRRTVVDQATGASRVNGPQVVILSGTPPPFGGVERRITSVGVFGAHRLAILRLRLRPRLRMTGPEGGAVQAGCTPRPQTKRSTCVRLSAPNPNFRR
ncbi:MAG: hypothetical protein HYY93_02430 [Planctomycetes bacterium]|nr:hypothetical protein [Planctomycetota bacterium]